MLLLLALVGGSAAGGFVLWDRLGRSTAEGEFAGAERSAGQPGPGSLHRARQTAPGAAPVRVFPEHAPAPPLPGLGPSKPVEDSGAQGAWSQRFSQAVNAALSGSSMVGPGAGKQAEARLRGATAVEPFAAGASGAGVLPAGSGSGSGSRAPTLTGAPFSWPSAALGGAAPGSPGGGKPRLAPFSGGGAAQPGAGQPVKGFQLRAGQTKLPAWERASLGSASQNGQSGGSDTAPLSQAAPAAMEASQNAMEKAQALRRAAEEINIDYVGPVQDDPVLSDIHAAMTQAKLAGLDAASRLENYANGLITQSNNLMTDLTQAQVFSANPFATVAPTPTAQFVPPPPDISAQLAAMQDAVERMDKHKKILMQIEERRRRDAQGR